MTHEDTQSPLAHRQENQARTELFNHDDHSALENTTQPIPSIVVTDTSSEDAFVNSLRLDSQIDDTTFSDDLDVVQGADIESNACVHVSHNQKILSLQSDIDAYVP